MVKRILGILLVAGWSSFGQMFTFSDQGWIGAIATPVQTTPTAVGTTPTNISGVAIYLVAEDYTTNSLIATWPNRADGFTALTNNTTSEFFKIGDTLNGHPTKKIMDTYKLYSKNSFPPSFAVWAVYSVTNNGNWDLAACGAVASHKVALVRQNSGAFTRITETATVYFEPSRTNEWLDEVFIINGASSETWTNGVRAVAANTGTANGWTNFVLGNWQGGLAQFAIFTNLANVTSNNIFLLHQYRTNYYGGSP